MGTTEFLLDALAQRSTVSDLTPARAFLIATDPTGQHRAYIGLTEDDVADLAEDCGSHHDYLSDPDRLLAALRSQFFSPPAPGERLLELRAATPGLFPLGSVWLSEGMADRFIDRLETGLMDRVRRAFRHMSDEAADEFTRQHRDLAAQLGDIAEWPDEYRVAAEVESALPRTETEVLALQDAVLAETAAPDRLRTIQTLDYWFGARLDRPEPDEDEEGER